jgi:multiple antibiotic resistance protein
MPVNLVLDAVVLTIGALLPIMNPFSTAPLFVSLTAGCSEPRRNREARDGCVYAFGILITFLLLGGFIIDFFGISIAGMRVAGGLIIAVIGFRMLFPQPRAAGAAAADTDGQELGIAFTPIAMPSLAGPGSISVVLTGATQIRSGYGSEWPFIYAGVILGMALTLVFAYLVLRGAGKLVRFLGPSGIDAMTRIFGFLLVCIGMQFLLTGIGDFFQIRPN